VLAVHQDAGKVASVPGLSLTSLARILWIWPFSFIAALLQAMEYRHFNKTPEARRGEDEGG
jgi:hypothetical protein